ncbi:MAG: MCE family protein [Opitutaceae bacterium]|nr:MCE family protein [Opitutaceae bacterium]
MKTKVSPAIVGAFALGAFALGIVVLLAFGGVNFFSKPQRFVVYFDESIHGLDLGSPVKLRGVRVGRVADLTVRYDERKNHSVVVVTCEFSRNTLTDFQGALINVAERGELQTLKEFPADARTTELKYVVVPAVPSAISEFQASASEILSKVRKIDFDGLSVELKTLLATTRRQVDGLDLKGVSSQWQRTGAAVETLASSPELKNAFVNLNATLVDLRTTLAKLDGQVTTAGADVHATLGKAQEALQNFNATALTLRSFINAQQGLGEGAGEAFGKLSEAADAVQRLADFLERNPNALLTGKKAPR